MSDKPCSYGSLIETAAKFVADQKGCWEHDAWEAFTDQTEKDGLKMDEEARAALGSLLESMKFFYLAAPCKTDCECATPKTKAPAKPKAATAKKAAPRKKASA